MLNKSYVIQKKEDWNTITDEKLWIYNLHYHSFLLSSLSLSQKKTLMETWMQDNPWPKGVGWEPYPLSLRIVYWIKFLLINPLHSQECLLHNLYLQCFSLEKQIECHLLGNHLFENGKALFFAGIYFDNTKEATRWFKKGSSILTEQIQEQILEDGGHFERSPMYHAIILEGLLDIYQLVLIAHPIVCQKTNVILEKLRNLISPLIPKMLDWLSSLSHPDQKIAFFNDTTFGIAPETSDLYAYASSLGFFAHPPKHTFTHLSKSGYARAENKKAVLLADVGSVGPSYIPGHAHAQSLCFEFSLGEERLFVNTGISTYAAGQERAYERGTLAHNTVAIDGQNSSHVWASFRVAERAQTFDINASSWKDRVEFSASHNGYQNSKCRLIHRRTWSLMEQRLMIEDILEGKGTAKATFLLHLSPQWKIVSQEEKVIKLLSLHSQQNVVIQFPVVCDIETIPYGYSCGFNRQEESLCIRANVEVGLPASLRIAVKW